MDEYPRTLQFRIGFSTIGAVAELIDPFYPHVLKLTLSRNTWYYRLSFFLDRCPAFVQYHIRQWWPMYALPSCVVLKKLQKLEYTRAFENEQAMYKRLTALQGHLIPYFYGEAQCEGTRALLISFLPWPVVVRQERPCLAADEFRKRIEAAAEEIAKYGVVHDDPSMSNIILTEAGIMFVDLESVYEPHPGQESLSLHYSVTAFADNYENYLKNLENA